jgi:hypothetical protein
MGLKTAPIAVSKLRGLRFLRCSRVRYFGVSWRFAPSSLPIFSAVFYVRPTWQE